MQSIKIYLFYVTSILNLSSHNAAWRVIFRRLKVAVRTLHPLVAAGFDPGMGCAVGMRKFNTHLSRFC